MYTSHYTLIKELFKKRYNWDEGKNRRNIELQNPMNDGPTGKASTNEPTTDWERVRCMSDADIHAAVASEPDIIPTDEDFWRNAKVVLPQRKPTTTIILDADV